MFGLAFGETAYVLLICRDGGCLLVVTSQPLEQPTRTSNSQIAVVAIKNKLK